MTPGLHLCAEREQMAGRFPWSSLGTGHVWTPLMDGVMGRVAAGSRPRGARVVRVPHPGASGKWEDSSWHGAKLRTAAKERSWSGSGRKKRRWWRRRRATVVAAALPHQLRVCPGRPGGPARSAPPCGGLSPRHLPGRDRCWASSALCFSLSSHMVLRDS